MPYVGRSDFSAHPVEICLLEEVLEDTLTSTDSGGFGYPKLLFRRPMLDQSPVENSGQMAKQQPTGQPPARRDMARPLLFSESQECKREETHGGVIVGEEEEGSGEKEKRAKEGDYPPPRATQPAMAPQTAKRREIEWRIEETWNAFVKQRQRYMERTRRVGAYGPTPTLTPAIRETILESLREYDAHLMGEESREEWKRWSKTRGAGIGIFFSPHHTGENETQVEYLEAWRPWRRQRGKERPTETFAQIYFDLRAVREARTPPEVKP